MTCCWAGAVNADQAREFELDIPSQDVATALNELATQVGALLLFSYDPVQSVNSNPVIGRYTVAEALERLLRNTGLSGGFTEGGVITVSHRTLAVVQTEPEGGEMNVKKKKKAGLGAILAAFFTVSVNAQEPGDTDDKTEQALEEIIVTGSRIRGAENSAPVIFVTLEDIDRGGFATVEQLMDSLPQNFGAGANQENFTDPFGSVSIGAASGAETSVNLRGLGPDSTLVLINGRRVTSSGFSGAFVDVSSIPLAAIERVEVLTDGASAIYGADAIGGAVNFILRNDYGGAETRLRVGPDIGADTSDVRFSQIFGKSWDTGNVMLSYEYFNQDNLSNSDRAFAASSDLTPLGGDNFSQPGGNPGNIDAGGNRFAIPAGQDGTSLAPTDFVAGTENLRNRRIGQDLLPDQERHSVLVNFRQRISDAVEAFAEVRYSKREATTSTFRGVLDLDVPDSNPFFVDPTGTGLTTVEVDDYDFFDDIGPQLTDGEVETYATAIGAEFGLGESWQAAFFGTYSTEETSTLVRNAVNRSVLNAALADSDPQQTFNPFADGSNTSASVIDSLRTSGNGIDVDLDLWSLNFSSNGTIFDLPGGAAKLAVGVEYREESIDNSSRSGAEFGAVVVDPGVSLSREVIATYAELFFPLVGRANGRPGLARLELSLAGRYEEYSDFGANTNPKLGLLWSPLESFSFRGTIGTSFKPPLLTQLETSTNLVIFVPFTPVPALFQIGGNQDLKAEEATTWTAGVQFAPVDLPDLNLELTYFDIDFDDRIEQATSDLFGVFGPEFAPLVNLMPTQEQLVALANDPGFLDLFGVSPDDIISGAVPVGAIADLRLNNVATSRVTGLDFLASYNWKSAIGEIGLGLNASYLFDVKQQILASLPLNELVDTVGNPIDLRMRGSATWSKGGWGASVFVNYTDSYKDDVSDPVRGIDSWTTVDLQLSYEASKGLWDGTKVSLSVQNLFDKDPPFANLNRGLGYDPVNSGALGQFIAIELIKTW